MRRRSVAVFYDSFERTETWGKHLPTHLRDVYERHGRFAVVFLSKHYLDTGFTELEFRSALDRTLGERIEYIVPVLLDGTHHPRLSKGVAWINMDEETPVSLADRICAKLGHPTADEDGDLFRWAASSVTLLGENMAAYQGIAVSPSLPTLEGIIHRGIRSLADKVQRDATSTWWTTEADRRFDRLYATSTVAVTLGHLGVGTEGPLLGPAVEYLRHSDASDLGERAGPMGLLSLGLLDAVATASLIDALAARQVSMGSSAGSFVLLQGPTVDRRDRNWLADKPHTDGANFHACHIADLLLHIPADQPDNRRRAAPVLEGIRGFLHRTLAANDGMLRDQEGRPTQRTLYGYALCPMLSLPLPPNWLEVARTVLENVAADPGPTLTRCFAMMNCAYLGAQSPDPAFPQMASEWVTEELSQVCALVEDPDPVRSALALRAVAYGVELIDTRFGGSARAAGRTAAGS